MKIKAKTSFIWRGLSMTKGEIADVPEKLAEDAVKNRLAELFPKKALPVKQRPPAEPQNEQGKSFG